MLPKATELLLELAEGNAETLRRDPNGDSAGAANLRKYQQKCSSVGKRTDEQKLFTCCCNVDREMEGDKRSHWNHSNLEKSTQRIMKTSHVKGRNLFLLQLTKSKTLHHETLQG